MIDDGLDSIALANFYCEQEEPARILGLTVQSVPWLSRPFLDESIDNTSLHSFFLDQEEGGYQPITRELARFEEQLWLVVSAYPSLDEGIDNTTLANRFIDQEESPRVLALAVMAVPWLAWVVQDEDPSTTAPTINFDDEQPAAPPVQSVIWLPHPWLDEGIDSAALAYFPIEQEDTWIAQLTNVVQAVPWLAHPFLDEGIDRTTLASFFLEIEDAWPQLRQSIAWTALASLDEDPLSFFTLPYEDEQPWVGYVQANPWMPRPFLEDGIDSVSLAYFYREQEDAWPQLAQLIPWLAVGFLDEDPLGFAPTQMLDEEYSFLCCPQRIDWLSLGCAPSIDTDDFGTASPIPPIPPLTFPVVIDTFNFTYTIADGFPGGFPFTYTISDTQNYQ